MFIASIMRADAEARHARAASRRPCSALALAAGQRTTLYRMVERIGRWSMLDVFVVTLTVALVRFKSIAIITAGPGAIGVRGRSSS